jgi:beta-phosphoglucomutase-like phosphatase (HAD superfamily)
LAYQARTLGRFQEELRLVDGVRSYIDAFAHVPRCIASSSSPDRLALCLELLGLQSEFGRNAFSASAVARGKPHPDISFTLPNRWEFHPPGAWFLRTAHQALRQQSRPG